MFEVLMMDWKGHPIPRAHMLVARRVAIMARGALQAIEVGFDHEICAGILYFQHIGIFGAIGGSFFFVDFGAANGQPNTAHFFIPRASMHIKSETGLVFEHALRLERNNIYASEFPDDVPNDEAGGAGRLKVIIRVES